ncbi:low temperature requirement protein A [Streptomyces liangshanensis]|uniref:low temperature requirement protein A n=1 Tax=Streptomyces liangshanensis TaxID=2717324 RepID=UPI0036DF30D3
MRARSADERHRTSTALELFFDLCFVVAVSQAAAAFEHEVAAGRVGHGLAGYAAVFFSVWWAWMNFTWFASAYDTDDVPYRLLTLIQIAGALTLAAGAPRALEHADFTVITLGYVIMRLAMVGQWLRAAHSDPERRRCCLRYVAGILVAQVGWVVRLGFDEQAGWWSFGVLVVVELAVPPWAERAVHTIWHPSHIAERFGLFTLIVLGETVTAATAAVQTALAADASYGRIIPLAVGGILTVFAMWWLYFNDETSRQLDSLAASLRWGYGHYAVFTSAVAVGAGLAVNVAQTGHHTHIGATTAAAVYTVPVAVYATVLRLLRRNPDPSRALDALWVVAVLGILAATFASDPVLVTGLVTAALVTAMLVVLARPRK